MKNRDNKTRPATADASSARDKRTLVLFLFGLLLIALHFNPATEPSEPGVHGILHPEDGHEWRLLSLTPEACQGTVNDFVTEEGEVAPLFSAGDDLEEWPLDLLFFFNRPVPINQVDTEHLVRLPGIGPHRAAAITDDRQRRGPFTGPDDLLRVSGIGPKTLERLLPLISFTP
jgi:competence ComEA-like helix-hairpin-helix protein